MHEYAHYYLCKKLYGNEGHRIIILNSKEGYTLCKASKKNEEKEFLINHAGYIAEYAFYTLLTAFFPFNLYAFKRSIEAGLDFTCKLENGDCYNSRMQNPSYYAKVKMLWPAFLLYNIILFELTNLIAIRLLT